MDSKVTFNDPARPGVYIISTPGYGGLCEPPLPDSLLVQLRAALGDTWKVENQRLGSPFPGQSISSLEITSLMPERLRDDAAVEAAATQVFRR